MRQLHEIMPNLWALEVSTQDLDVRAVVIEGEKYTVVWDTLTRPRDMVSLKDRLAGKAFHVVYSHGDWDHIWGTGGFADRPLDIIAHSECLRRFGDDVPRKLRQQQIAELGLWDSVRLVPPNLTFGSRLDLDLGNVTLELHHLPGHTVDSIIGWLPEWGVFVGGDTIESPLPVVNSARLVDDWLTALQDWASRDELTCAIPSHGTVDGRVSLDETVKYLVALKGDRDFDLPPVLEDFYRETHQKNLIVVDSDLELHE